MNEVEFSKWIVRKSRIEGASRRRKGDGGIDIMIASERDRDRERMRERGRMGGSYGAEIEEQRGAFPLNRDHLDVEGGGW